MTDKRAFAYFKAVQRRFDRETSPSQDRTKDQVIAASRRRLDEIKYKLKEKGAELRQKQREIDTLYGKLVTGNQLADSEFISPGSDSY